MTWKSFIEKGEGVKDQVIMDIVAKQKPGECAILIYTSGTTGNPKGVMLSHDNLLFTTLNIMDDLELIKEARKDGGDNNRIVSYLPLSHIAGLEIDLFGMIVAGI